MSSVADFYQGREHSFWDGMGAYIAIYIHKGTYSIFGGLACLGQQCIFGILRDSIFERGRLERELDMLGLHTGLNFPHRSVSHFGTENKSGSGRKENKRKNAMQVQQKLRLLICTYYQNTF